MKPINILHPYKIDIVMWLQKLIHATPMLDALHFLHYPELLSLLDNVSMVDYTILVDQDVLECYHILDSNFLLVAMDRLSNPSVHLCY